MNKIYAVVEQTEQRFDNDLCWEDGYYDDYYETVVTSTDYIAFYSTKEEAEKCSKYLNEKEDSNTLVFEIVVNKKFNKEDFE